MTKDRASIHDRPKEIEALADFGHWEAELIVCKDMHPVLVLHEPTGHPHPSAFLRIVSVLLSRACLNRKAAASSEVGM